MSKRRMSKRRILRPQNYICILFIIALGLFCLLFFVLFTDKIQLTIDNYGNKSSQAGIITIINKSVMTTCNPAYFMWDGALMSRNPRTVKRVYQHGFRINCEKELSRKELNTFYHYVKMTQRKDKSHKYFCSKYDSSHSKENINKIEFCNGGRIINICGPEIAAKYQLNIFKKHHLNKLLSKYCPRKDNVCNFKILSYNIENKQERIEFLSKHIDCTNDKAQYDKTWVFKEDKDQGTGVHFYNNHQLIYRLIATSSDEHNRIFKQCAGLKPLVNKTYFVNEGFKYAKIKQGYKVDWKGLIMQQFIHNPLLLENKAFHLRSYGLIASYSNPLIVLMYPEGILFRNPRDYQYTKLDKNVLLSNGGLHLQKPHKNSTFFKKLWGFYRLQIYLNQLYGKKVSDYTTNKLRNDVIYIAKHVFNANSYNNKLHKVKSVEQDLYNNNIDLKFHVFCMDIIINNKLELKLLEVNYYCGICCPGQIHPVSKGNCDDIIDNAGYEWMCNGFYKESLDIVFEIYNRKYYNNLTFKTIDSLNKYDIVLWQ